jgi:hypothetical protein
VPYIGKQLVRGQNRKLDDISSGFNGSQTTFTLQVASQNVTVGSALQLWISLGGVIQDPLSDYTIAGNQITFTTAPAASLDFFGVIQGDVTDTNTPGDATVTTSKLATGLTVNLADGSAATSSLQLGGTDSGLFSSAADKVNVTTGGVERLEIGDSEVVFNDPSNDVDFRVESNGNTHMLFVDGGNDRVGIGTSSPAHAVHIAGATTPELIVEDTTNNVKAVVGADNTVGRIGTDTNHDLTLRTNDTERMRIDSSGNVGIGATSPNNNLHINQADSGNNFVQFTNSTTGTGSSDGGLVGINTAEQLLLWNYESDDVLIGTNNLERLRIDSSGRLLINHSASRSVGSARIVQIEGTSNTTAGVSLLRNSNDSNSPTINLGKSRGTSTGSNTIVQDGDGLGSIYFRAADGTDINSIAASIDVGVDGTPGSNDTPGRIMFGTTADGASSPTERMRITNDGRLALGLTSNITSLFHVESSFAGTIAEIKNTRGSASTDNGLLIETSTTAAKTLLVQNAGTERFSVKGDGTAYFNGNVGIGTSSPAGNLQISGSGDRSLLITGGTSGTTSVQMGDSSDADAGAILYNNSNNSMQFKTNASERMRLTSAGHLGIGTTSPPRALTNADDVTLTTGNAPQFRLNGGAGDSNDDDRAIFGLATASGHFFSGSAANDAVLRSPNGGDLLFGEGTTERARLDSTGNFLVGKDELSDTSTGLSMRVGGVVAFEATVASGAAHAMMLNRQGDDGTYIKFRQANTLEGSITVSGSTVSYNGGHLARWSQLADGAERTAILRGCVLSNLDEMCEWGEEDNEQLNRMKISDVEGDPNVAGVFQDWDDNDDTYTNDFYCAMTGDFVIRIAQGTTVARGDLLMSAGDGTAKPQDDDIVRSKTIAKVTSTTVSTTYADGSYCVPCVLMAC